MSNSTEIYSGFVGDGPMIGEGMSSELQMLHSTASSTLWVAVVDGRRRVFKTLAPAVRDSEPYRRMIRKEFDIMSRLSHPAIVMALGFRVLPDLGDAVEMEWIDGMTLEAWLGVSHSRGERRRVAQQLFDAVDYIHKKGIVHRDLKPSNILVTNDGEFVKIIDFGLADTTAHVELKNPAGTEGYMSEHQRVSFDPRLSDDLYALSSVVSQLLPEDGALLGKKSFESVADLRRHLQARWARPVKMRRIAFTLFALLVLAGVAAWFNHLRQIELDRQAARFSRQLEFADSARQQAVSRLNDSVALLRGRAEELDKESRRRQQELDAEVQHRKFVEEVINKYSRRIDGIWSGGSRRGVEEYDILKEGYRIIRKYVDDNPDDLTSSDLAAIETALTTRHRQCSEKWKNKKTTTN